MRIKATYFLYRLLLLAASPLLLFYFLTRTARDRRYWNSFPERLGVLPPSFQQTGFGAIWLHAVSVGEVLSSQEFLRGLRCEFPTAPLYVSTGTLAGRAIATQKLAGLADGVFFAPLDYVWIVRRVLRRIRPSLVIIAETELWPNLFREVKRAGCGLLVVNGRISDRAMPRYRRWRWFFRAALEQPDRICAQTSELRDRYLELGAPPDRTTVGGNLKYDFQPGAVPEAVERFLERTKPEVVWIAASTMPPDEEETVLEAFPAVAARYPGLLLVLAPRKPERFELAAQLLARARVPFVKRSALTGETRLSLPGVLLLDSVGELSGLFARGDVVFVGGSLVTHGGHNALEPAVFSKPIVTGPYMQNFPDIAAQFREAAAWAEVRDARELGATVERLLANRGEARALGERARACAESRRGATAAALAVAREVEQQAVPRLARPLPLRLVAWPLARLWQAGGLLKRAWNLRGAVHLPVPVISVGNLTMGGSGKTPTTLWLARRLDQPAILTRGYGRTASRTVLLGPGETAPVADTGDEPQIFIRSGVAAVGIGADRGRTGLELLERRPFSVAVLDDGFQHARLRRDADIVLIDALDPLAGGDVFPNGRLREMPAALARADILIVTRSERPRPGLEAWLRRHNSRAPIFYQRFVSHAWVEGSTGRELPASTFAGAHVGAFCGLAQPDSFWRTLAALGVKPQVRLTFPDHAVYEPARLASHFSGCEAAVTTEKDWVKLAACAPPHVFWLRMEAAFDDEEAFWAALAGCDPRLPALRRPPRG